MQTCPVSPMSCVYMQMYVYIFICLDIRSWERRVHNPPTKYLYQKSCLLETLIPHSYPEEFESNEENLIGRQKEISRDLSGS